MAKLRQFTADHKAKIIWAVVSILILAALSTFGVLAWQYRWAWTGFFSYTTPKSNTMEFRPDKTLWDWLELLIIPLVLVAGGILFNRAQRQNELEIAAKERDTEREIAKDREEERALQSYLEAMTGLLLKENLRTSEEAQSIARSRTLTVLMSLNSHRKGSILRFLYEAKLINSEKTVLNLAGAYLMEASLWQANLHGANLYGANLGGAALWGANLAAANLGATNLTAANLTTANLKEANLKEADLEGAHLVIARLGRANLEGASLDRTNLMGADLRGANLTRARLGEANLERAHLEGANLELANLGAANLKKADLEEANLRGAFYNSATKWPPNFDPEEAGAIKVEFDSPPEGG